MANKWWLNLIVNANLHGFGDFGRAALQRQHRRIVKDLLRPDSIAKSLQVKILS